MISKFTNVLNHEIALNLQFHRKTKDEHDFACYTYVRKGHV